MTVALLNGIFFQTWTEVVCPALQDLEGLPVLRMWGGTIDQKKGETCGGWCATGHGGEEEMWLEEEMQ